MTGLESWPDQLTAYAQSRPEGLVDVVFIDYPWPNASARRSKSYEGVDIYDFYKIELPKILSKPAAAKPVLVAFWVTNHPKYRRFIKEKLMPAWSIGDAADWYWVKITDSAGDQESKSGGRPIWALDGPSPRRCYEGV